jgi:hypothetical protein
MLEPCSLPLCSLEIYSSFFQKPIGNNCMNKINTATIQGCNPIEKKCCSLPFSSSANADYGAVHRSHAAAFFRISGIGIGGVYD